MQRIWKGTFGSFAEAQGNGEVFDGDYWLDKNERLARDAQALARSDAAIAPIAETKDYVLPVVAALAARSDACLRILDFGGGMGTLYLKLALMLPASRALQFVVVETPAVCARARDVFRGSSHLEFRSELPSEPDAFDIVHCGSSLHYVDDWTALLERFAALKPRYMIFVDLPAADNLTFVTAQQYYGKRIPVRFWNLGEFVEHVARRGYEPIFQARYKGIPLETESGSMMEEFDREFRLDYFSQVIFRKTEPGTGLEV